jgi:hypothetical protein
MNWNNRRAPFTEGISPSHKERRQLRRCISLTGKHKKDRRPRPPGSQGGDARRAKKANKACAKANHDIFMI